MSRLRRLAMVDRGHPGLSVVKQCRLLQLSRSAVYYRPTPTNPADLDLMAGMGRQYLKTRLPDLGNKRNEFALDHLIPAVKETHCVYEELVDAIF